jgi:hypothetical protein
MIRIAAILLCLATSAIAQPMPALDPAIQLGVCRQDRSRFFLESEQARSYVEQYTAEIADLKKKLAEAEAKLSLAPPSKE